jgi:CHASE2 domain-containing sensor protein/class 3 adenylate cyclase/tRNA A-37 threonylcarbamoyl transferase component Bud32
MEEFRRRHRSGVLVLLFTDMVGSTKLKQDLGDQQAVALIWQHHAVIRQLLKEFPDGKEIDRAGDSFFIVFVKPSDGVKFALSVQAAMRRLSAEAGHRIVVRIGIHAGEVFIGERTHSVDLYGIQVDSSARVMSLAQGNQILLTRFVFDNARQLLKGGEIDGVEALSWLNHGPYLMKGVEESLEICEVGEVGASFLARPPDTEKAHRHISADAEPVLGWRPAVGQTVPNSSWVLERELGAGGFGEVWLGRHEKLKERRVFKFCFHADRVRSLKREVTLFRLLKEHGNHPNIVAIQDVFFDKPPFYIMMDYAEGTDLAGWAAQQGGLDKVPLEARLEIVAQVADALQAAHEAGIIHRDVKPSNIIVCGAFPATFQVKLTDFGIGQVVSKDVLSGITQMGFTQTITGTSDTGTPLYTAPELLVGKPPSTRADIYSLGIVLFQLVTADLRKPVTMDWNREVADPLLRDDLARCLAGNPQERFPAASELASRLRGVEERRKTLAKEAVESTARETAGRRRRLFLAGAIASVLAIVMGVGLLLSRFGDNLTRLSYDTLYWGRGLMPADEVRMVYLDDLSHTELRQPMDAPWDRSLHAQLIARLTAAGAKLIVFDILFTGPSADAAADKQLAEAIRNSGRVVLSGNFHPPDSANPQNLEEMPYEPFRSGAAGWGNGNLAVDWDGGVRRFSANELTVSGSNVASLPWKAAELAGQHSLPANLDNACLNFPGPPGTIPWRSFSQALREDADPGYFKDKIVFVGAHVTAAYTYTGSGKDEFRTPWSDGGMAPAPGVDFHAIATLNLLQRSWLTRMPLWAECVVAVVIALAGGFGMTRLRPLPATAAAAGAIALIYAAARVFISHGFLWFPWLIFWIEVVVILVCSCVWEFVQPYLAMRRTHQQLPPGEQK